MLYNDANGPKLGSTTCFIIQSHKKNNNSLVCVR